MTTSGDAAHVVQCETPSCLLRPSQSPSYRRSRTSQRSTKHQAPSTKHQAPSTKHQAPSTQHQAPSTKHQAPSTKNRHDTTLHPFLQTLFNSPHDLCFSGSWYHDRKTFPPYLLLHIQPKNRPFHYEI